MPASAVYQPTTVTYEQQPTDQQWNCPTSYFARRVTNGLFFSERAVYVRITIGVLGCVLSIVGLALTITAGVKYNSAPQPAVDAADDSLALLVAGAVVLCLGLCIAGICIWAWSSRWVGGKDAPVSGGTGLTGLNPSTDPLVAAQYAPVRDAPPAPDDETRNLMDNKECLSSAEESDKMLDGRPAVA